MLRVIPDSVSFISSSRYSFSLVMLWGGVAASSSLVSSSEASLVVESAWNAGDLGLIPGFDPWVGKIPWRRTWKPTPVFLRGESPWTEEPGGLQFMGSKRVRPNQVTNAHDWAANTGCFLFLCLFFTSLSIRTESQRVFSIKQSILVSQQIVESCALHTVCV